LIFPLLIASHAFISAVGVSLRMWAVAGGSVAAEFVVAVVAFALGVHLSVGMDAIVCQFYSLFRLFSFLSWFFSLFRIKQAYDRLEIRLSA